jgi:hypothetical protein
MMPRIIKVIILASLFFFIFEPFLFSQQHFPFQKSSDKEWVFKEKTYDEVWSAVVKALMQVKYKIISSDKNGGLVSATKKKGLLDGEYSKDEMPSFDIYVEKIEANVEENIEASIKVSCQSTKYSGQLFGGDKSKKLFEKIAEILYGKPEEKNP